MKQSTLFPAGLPLLSKSHYSFKKRKKEIARKLKQEQKRQRKLQKSETDVEEGSDKLQEDVENVAVAGKAVLPAPE